ncbi:MAG: AarF/ABC1/UbiB kinase family protein [Proteobacteria bacterium]|nr:AarF/ABC1/UbiB kinase family protein [Pseudomonadota bacterium]
MGKTKKPIKTLRRLATTSLERNSRLMASALFSSGRIALASLSERLGVGSKEQVIASQVQLLVDQLGKLKGSAQKIGQFFSIVGEQFFPEEIMKMLRTLQSETPALAWDVIEKVLKRQLSQELLDQLEISPDPLATASIGQVHRAVIKSSGRQIVLKIQYPGVDKTIDSDIKTLKIILKGLSFLPKIADLDGIFEEVRSMMKREVDYVRERETMEEVRQSLVGDSRYFIPETFPQFCTKRILAASYEEGLEIASPEVAALPLDLRSQLAESFLELFFKEFFELGYVQTDPHFGNYRIRFRGTGLTQFILFDFGAMRKFPRKFVNHYAAMIVALLANDRNGFEEKSRLLGMESAGEGFSEQLWTLSNLIIDPFRGQKAAADPRFFDEKGRFDWGPAMLSRDVSAYVLANKFSFNLKGIPRELVFLDRKLAGVHTMLVKLNAPTRTLDLLWPKISPLGA